MNKLYIGSDHAGFETKEIIKQFLNDNFNYNLVDLGCNSKNSCSYVDIAKLMANNIRSDNYAFGVLLCGTGIGISIAANRFDWVRAALCYNIESAKLAREHNDANILVLGAKTIHLDTNLQILNSFLKTSFSNESRHIQRLLQLKNIKEDCGETK